MYRIAIIYGSTHHGNTYQLVDAIARKYSITMIDATQVETTDLSGYDLIGFASGIDFGRFYESVEQFLIRNLPQGKQVFFLYTCAKTSPRFTASIKEAARKKNAVILGEYGCRGYNTYGPWKLIGGMNKSHPTKEEQNNAILFFEAMLNTTKKTDL